MRYKQLPMANSGSETNTSSILAMAALITDFKNPIKVAFPPVLRILFCYPVGTRCNKDAAA